MAENKIDTTTPGPVIISNPSVAKLTNVSVDSEGELVCFTVGNSTIKMHYTDAFKISQWLRMHGKRCKTRAGDKGTHWSALADLQGIKT